MFSVRKILLLIAIGKKFMYAILAAYAPAYMGKIDSNIPNVLIFCTLYANLFKILLGLKRKKIAYSLSFFS
jgi:hypothetical protein